MRRIGLPLLVFALGAASCSGTEASSETIVSTTTTEGRVTTSTMEAETSDPETSTTAATTATTEAAPPALDGPPAPDFTLALADGTDFVLSEEQKPVYMVFWAEW
jgi:hypothetical protein